jgi:hypothetical protein
MTKLVATAARRTHAKANTNPVGPLHHQLAEKSADGVARGTSVEAPVTVCSEAGGNNSSKITPPEVPGGASYASNMPSRTSRVYLPWERYLSP